MFGLRSVALAFSALAAALLPPVASARDFVVKSFDGTTIAGHLFPAAGLRSGDRAPTVLVGAGWGSPAETNPNSASNHVTGALGLGPLRAAGYNVLTWDPRGFGSSGGESKFDSVDFEARDVQALLDYVARQPHALLDAAGDPRVGMAGGSYGGGIQFAAAAIDKRSDAIVPSFAWHSLLSSLDKDQTLKAAWLASICSSGAALSAVRLDHNIVDACTSGLGSGSLSAPSASWLPDPGPGRRDL